MGRSHDGKEKIKPSRRVSWVERCFTPDQGEVGDEIVRGTVQYRPIDIFGPHDDDRRRSGRIRRARRMQARGGVVP